jgi:hypothetical protein
MALILSLLVSWALAETLPQDKATSVPRHVNALHDFLAAKAEPKVGVLSDANFDSVHTLLPEKTTPVKYEDMAHLIAATRNQEVDASVISGLPEDQSGLVMFSSTIVSVDTMFSALPADTLRLAIDAAIVRTLHNKGDRTAAEKNPPMEFVAVHTCRTDQVEKFPFPEPVAGDRLSQAIDRGSLRIASYGPFDWGGNTGNYKVDPPTGFWPEYYNAIEKEFKAHYNIDFERVYSMSGAGTMNLLLDGDADVTEPYMTVESYHNMTVDGKWTDVPRWHSFVLSCSTLATDSTFLVADTDLQSELKRENELEQQVKDLQLEVKQLKGEEASGALAVTAGALVALLS